MDGIRNDVEFKREMNRNYMVLPETGGKERYAVRMFTDNPIPGFLPFHEKSMNGVGRYYYDITSKQPLVRMLEYRKLAGGELEKLLTALLFSLKQVERYLLNESCISLEPEFIFVEPDSFQCFFCYIPGQCTDFAQGLRALAQYLLDHVNHQDGEAVVLAFTVFKECQKENFGMDGIERCLMRKGKKKEEPGKKDLTTTASPDSGMAVYSAASRQDDFVPTAKPLPVDGELSFSKTGTWEETGASRTGDRGRDKDKGNDRDSDKNRGGDRNESSDRDRAWDNEKENEKRNEKGRLLLIIRIGFLAVMLFLPAAAGILWGIQGIVQYRWILGAAEILLAAALLIVSSGMAEMKKGTTAGGEVSEEEKAWEVYFREEDGDMEQEEDVKKDTKDERPDEEEMHTVLLTARPVIQDCRRLVSMSGNLEIPISYFPFLIGKSRDISDFCLDRPEVSRLHVKIEATDGGYTLTDLNSTNGTRINGRLLEANETCALPLNSELEIAAERFWFR